MLYSVCSPATMKKLLAVASLLSLTACSPAMPPANTGSGNGVMDNHVMHDMNSSSAVNEDIETRLNDSPRHHEWVDVRNGEKTISTFVAYPEKSGKTPVVLVIHENKGLSDWVRAMADEIAEEGYIAVAPDLLSDFDKDHKDSDSFASDDERTKAIMKLDPVQVMSDLNAVANWSETIPASNGKLATAGFCWGGSQSFAFATASNEPDLTLVFYGTGPTDVPAYANVTSPVYGFYAGNDERVNATIPLSTNAMADNGKTYEIEAYDGAGHAFMRTGEDPYADPANAAARDKAWERMKKLLGTL